MERPREVVDEDLLMLDNFIALIEMLIGKPSASTKRGYSSTSSDTYISGCSLKAMMRILRLLLEHRADEEAKDEKGLTPLHLVIDLCNHDYHIRQSFEETTLPVSVDQLLL